MTKRREKASKREKPDDVNPDTSLQESIGRDPIVWGTRFSKEEDAILRNAILNYFKSKGWAENEGISKILKLRKHKEAWGCWDIIRQCLPQRPKEAILQRSYRLLEPNEGLGRWSNEETTTLLRFQQEHGSKWRKLSDILKRGRFSIKVQSRQLKIQNAKGPWTDDEIKKLFELVHNCLWQKALEGTVSKQNDHRQHLRDNINWDLISEKLCTRCFSSCQKKWYGFLSSSLAASGQWLDGDDILLLKRLLECGACSEDEVEWNLLLEHRSGQVCQTRWKQMAKYLGEKRTSLFLEKLDLLVQRYAPQLVEMHAPVSKAETGQSRHTELAAWLMKT